MKPSLEQNKINKKVVRTFAEDVAGVIEGEKGGLIKKIIHGEEEREKEKIKLSPESKTNKLFMFASFLLLVASVAILSFLISKNNASTVAVEKQFVPLIFNDKSTFFEVKNFKKEEIEQTVSNEVLGTEVKTGGVEGIYLTNDKKVVELREFLLQIESVQMFNEFVEDNFLLGVVNGGFELASPAGKDFFILIKVRSLPDIFPSLRTWESKMFYDLHGFFGFQVSPETKYLLTKEFEDGIVQNKNARILRTADEKTVLMYVFVDDNSVVITNTENATREVMLRLASSRVKK